MVGLGGKYARDIYKYLSMALDRSIQHSRYDMPRSALQLLAKHACQWDQCIIDDYEVIHHFPNALRMYIRVVGASACVIFILHQKIQKMAKCTFWYRLTRVVQDKVQRAVK